ncbi:hypothetical protein D5F01_LYC20032 [Larimichthys crocea]|uniref:Uncharacterized protein n=1 Tax=Larimichthys crocea TaxID=215358 RepID=A0A6G0HTW3_LARCR|nr:hypothetical protein D5F01_LYC20032 [Larimichthys crocea]
MLPPNLLIVSIVIFLTTTISTAPVEDDDDSKSQDKIDEAGLVGVQQTTIVAVASGGSGVSSNIQDLSGHRGDPSSAARDPSSSAASQQTGNGQKLLNGGGGGGGDIQTGELQGVGLQEEVSENIQPSTHDFLLGLMGGGDPFGPGVHINIPGHMTPPTQLISTDPAHHSDISIDQSGPDRTSVSLVPDQSLSSSASSSSHSSSQGDGADSPDVNGNGRQTLLTDSNTAGGAESGTNFHIDLTASGLGLGHDVTESTPVVLHTESVDRFTHTASGGYSHTDLVTMAADSTGADTVSADPTGRPLDSTNPAVTDHTQAAGSVTEQYNPSGQGPEGAENVELEDTC